MRAAEKSPESVKDAVPEDEAFDWTIIDQSKDHITLDHSLGAMRARVFRNGAAQITLFARAAPVGEVRRLTREDINFSLRSLEGFVDLLDQLNNIQHDQLGCPECGDLHGATEETSEQKTQQ